VYEAQETLGGLNTFGIAPYKTTSEFARAEVADILDIGIEVKTKERVDGSKLLGLLEEYDAVFLSIGLGATASLDVPGENLKGVWESLEFIRQTHTRSPGKCVVGEHVLVIGGGNTAIDAANIAARLGAKTVTVAYRRDAGSMPAFRHEYELAVSSGVEFLWQSRPLRILGRGGKVTGVRLQRLKLDGRGRKAKLKPVRNSEHTHKCDMVIKALGQVPRRDLIESVPRLKLTKDGRVAADPETGRTSIPRLFAGGDCQNGAHEEVVNAVQAGKVAARGIHEMLAR
jgi:glutamate synthase (NADPH/NADH) small chain